MAQVSFVQIWSWGNYDQIFHINQVCLTMWKRTWEGTTEEKNTWCHRCQHDEKKKMEVLAGIISTEQAIEYADLVHWRSIQHLTVLADADTHLPIGSSTTCWDFTAGQTEEIRKPGKLKYQRSHISLSELQGHLREEPSFLVNSHGQSVQRAHAPTSVVATSRSRAPVVWQPQRMPNQLSLKEKEVAV